MVFPQDIIECTGPQSRLTELNGDVKKIFRNLRLRIQVGAHTRTLTKQHISRLLHIPVFWLFS